MAAGSKVLMKNHHRWAPINPTESHQRCWAALDDPSGTPIFYGWRHGVGRNSHVAPDVQAKKTVGIAKFARESLLQLHEVVWAETNWNLLFVRNVKGLISYFPHDSKKITQHWACMRFFLRSPNLLLHRWGPGLRRTWLPILLKKSKMIRHTLSLATSWVCRNFECTDLPLKLSERETATEKAAAD